jgi:hypothetical protein
MIKHAYISYHENTVQFLWHLLLQILSYLFIFFLSFFRFQLLSTAFTTHVAPVSPFKSFYGDSRKLHFVTLSERIKWSITQTQSSAGSIPATFLL